MTILPDLDVKVLSKERAGEGTFELLNDFTAQTDAAGIVTVPKGYVTDMASIPFFARWLLPQAGHSARASVLHDWLSAQDDPRAQAVFSEALRADGAGAIRRVLMVAFVYVTTYPTLHWKWMQGKG